MFKKKSLKTWSTPVAEEKSRLIPCALCGGNVFKPSLRCEGFSYVRCVSCGLAQINPQPLASEVTSRYRERHGGDYLAYELANEGAFLRLQLLALEDGGFWEREKPGRLLDIGCATGTLLAYLRERGWEAFGVEINEEEAGYGRRERGLEIRSLPLEETRFPENFFHAVLASHLIEHLNDPAALVREAYRILCPGGRFFVTTPNMAGFQAWLFGGRWRSAIFDHLYLFSKKTLAGLLEKEGFLVEKTATWGGLAAGSAPAPLKALFDRGAKRLGLGDVMIMRGLKIK
jgi:SAM-dependent methyltransferase